MMGPELTAGDDAVLDGTGEEVRTGRLDGTGEEVSSQT